MFYLKVSINQYILLACMLIAWNWTKNKRATIIISNGWWKLYNFLVVVKYFRIWASNVMIRNNNQFTIKGLMLEIWPDINRNNNQGIILLNHVIKCSDSDTIELGTTFVLWKLHWTRDLWCCSEKFGHIQGEGKKHETMEKWVL